MNKVRVIVTLAGLATPMAVLADTTLYGKMNATYGVPNDNGSTSHEIVSKGSVVGVKGFTPLNSGADATYIIEAGIDMSKDDVVSSTRQAWVGLRGTYGEFRAGRQFAATKVATAPVDMFTDQYGDYNAVMEGEYTYKQSVAYINRYGSFGYALELATDEALSPSSKKVTAADFVINYSNQGLYAAVAMLNAKDNLKMTRISGAYTFFDGHKVGAAFENHRPKAGGGHDAMVLSGGYKASDDLMLKAQYGTNKDKAGGKKETLLAVGLDYQLGKKTVLTLEHTSNKNRLHVGGDELKVTAVGLSHRF